MNSLEDSNCKARRDFMPDLIYLESNGGKMTSDRMPSPSNGTEIKSTRVEDVEDILESECTCLECLLQPIKLFLRYFGVDFVFGEGGHPISEKERKGAKWRKIYGICILLLTWLAAGRITTCFVVANYKTRKYFGDIGQILEKDGPALVYVYLTANWICCLSLFTFFFTDKTYYLIKMLHLWDDLRTEKVRHRKIEKSLLAWQKSMLFGASLLFVSTSIYVVLQMMYWRWIYMRPDEDLLNIAFQIFWTTLEKIYLYGLGIYGPVLLIFNNLIVIKTFEEYTEELADGIHGNLKLVSFQAMQIKYHSLVKLIGLNDSLLRGASNFAFPGLIFMQALMFYHALFNVIYPSTKIFMRITTSLTIIIFVISSCFPAAITSAAQRPYDVLYEATFLPIKVEDQFRIHDLMKQIGGSPVGLTWLNVFVMTKGAIIKVVSLLLSIFIFLVQFQQLNEGRDCNALEDREARAEFIQD